MVCYRLRRYLRKRNEDLSVRLKQPPKLEDTETQWIYYSSWQMAAVHLLLMTPEHRTPERRHLLGGWIPQGEFGKCRVQ